VWLSALLDHLALREPALADSALLANFLCLANVLHSSAAGEHAAPPRDPAARPADAPGASAVSLFRDPPHEAGAAPRAAPPV